MTEQPVMRAWSLLLTGRAAPYDASSQRYGG